MNLTEKMQELTFKCKDIYSEAESVIHQWGHIIRVSMGSVWFMKVLNESERNQQLSYMAGIMHDIYRPPKDVSHAFASSQVAKQLLEEDSEFSSREIEKICETIMDHSHKVEWKSNLHQSVFFADKVFEHMGAYLDFRATIWVAELSLVSEKEVEPIEAVLEYYKASKIKNKFSKNTYPELFSDLIEYQSNWNKEYIEALKNSEDWAVDFMNQLYKCGVKQENFEDTLMYFKPNGEKQLKWAKEMADYVTGKKYEFFKSLAEGKIDEKK